MDEIKFWQIASGDVGRDYSQLCLESDVMLLGPGEFGPYDPEAYQKPVDDRIYSKESIGYVRRFHDDVQPGDIVLLRYGHRVKGIGTVEGGYEYDSTFDDVDGWDLRHTRRVIWQSTRRASLSVRFSRSMIRHW